MDKVRSQETYVSVVQGRPVTPRNPRSSRDQSEVRRFWTQRRKLIGLAVAVILALLFLAVWSRRSSPAVEISPKELDLGMEQVGSRSTETSLRISNTGAAPLNISTAVLGGENAADFAKTADGCSGISVAPGGTCIIRVTFVPKQSDARHATLTISHNAGRVPAVISLTGVGIAPSPEFSPRTLQFDSQGVETASAAKTITLTNGNPAELRIRDVWISGPSADDFTKTSDSCTGATLASGRTCTIQIAFSPKLTGNHEAIVNIADNAADSPQTVTLSGMGIAAGAIATISPTSLDFGSKDVGTPSAPQSIVITSKGSEPVSIEDVTIVGAKAGAFEKISDTCAGATLPPGAACTIRVVFTPDDPVSLESRLTVTTRESSVPLTVALSGTGVVAGPRIRFDPASLQFPNQEVSSRSPVQMITVSNLGTSPLKISDVSVTGANADDFVLGNSGCGRTLIVPGDSCQIRVTFTPRDSGARTAILTVTANTAGPSPTVSLSGTGIGPIPAIEPTSIDFGDQADRQRSAPRTINLTNHGSAPWKIRTLSVTGADSSDFLKMNDQCAGATLSPNSSCSVSVVFMPRAPGDRNATLTITDNTGESPHSVTLHGTSLSAPVPQASISAARLDFGTIGVGSRSVAQTIEVKSTGPSALEISHVGIAGADASAFDIVSSRCERGSIQPGTSCAIAVVFTPKEARSYSATLNVADDAADSPQSVALSGSGAVPVLDVSPTSLDFGSQHVRASSEPRTITLDNRGAVPWKVRSARLSGTNAADFSKVEDRCSGTDLDPGTSCTIKITFSPKAGGTRDAVLTITGDSSDSQRVVALHGVGQ